MAVSKRLRYEIFRRDNHTCRYCGATAPNVPLRIDHVTPVALGGTDTPDNLVTACEACNSGKTSTTPGAPLVADVAQDALRWSAAMQAAAAQVSAQVAEADAYRSEFLAAWNQWTFSGKHWPLPAEWRPSIERFRAAGLPAAVWPDAVDAAMSREHVDAKFNYVCGVAWKRVTDMQTIARQLLVEADTATEQAASSPLIDLAVEQWIALRSSEDHETEATPEDVAAFRQSVTSLTGDYVPGDIMYGARAAGALGTTDLAEGIERHREHQLFKQRRVAHDIWLFGWCIAAQTAPSVEQGNAVWVDCVKLFDAGASMEAVCKAAAYAAAHLSTRMHYGLFDAEVELLGVHRLQQASEDLWVGAWMAASPAETPPSDEDRRAFRASCWRVGVDGGFWDVDVYIAAASAGSYQDCEIRPHLTRHLSVFEAAACPLGHG